MVKFDYIPTQRKAKLICEQETFDVIRAHFSVENPDAKHAKKWGKKVASRFYAITPTGMFEYGVYKEIEVYLRENDIPFSYTDNFKERMGAGYPDKEFWDGLKFKVRDYQKETIELGLKVGQGTVVIGTGGGKSLITASLIENIKRRTTEGLRCLIVVPGLSLVNQLTKDFNEYEVTFDHKIWTGENEYQEAEVIICNSENLNAKFGKIPKLEKKINLLIVDEVHSVSAKNKISKIVSKFTTPNKFGFTGTLPKTPRDVWKIVGLFGPVIYEMSSKELRDQGFLVNVYIKMLKLLHPKKRRFSYKNELDFVYNSDSRNQLIKKLATKIKNNTLVLVNHLEQGNNLYELLLDIPDKRVFFIQGSTEIDNRGEIQELMSNNDNIIVIAVSKIFATGINIPNIHNLLFVAGGKAFIRTVQGIGRGLRLHPSKDKLTIIDIYDNLHYSEDHAELRKEIYDDEKIQWSETEINL